MKTSIFTLFAVSVVQLVFLSEAGATTKSSFKTTCTFASNKSNNVVLDYKIKKLGKKDQENPNISSEVTQIKSLGSMTVTYNDFEDSMIIENTSGELVLDYFIANHGPFLSGVMPNGTIKDAATLKLYEGSKQGLLVYKGDVYSVDCDRER